MYWSPKVSAASPRPSLCTHSDAHDDPIDDLAGANETGQVGNDDLSRAGNLAVREESDGETDDDGDVGDSIPTQWEEEILGQF